VHDRRHESQYSARALEAFKRRPVLVEPIEQLGMYRVRILDALLVIVGADLPGELGRVFGVQLGEAPAGDVAMHKLVWGD
jgi:hypothetical protein